MMKPANIISMAALMGLEPGGPFGWRGVVKHERTKAEKKAHKARVKKRKASKQARKRNR
jgi:hypothetical protein